MIIPRRLLMSSSGMKLALPLIAGFCLFVSAEAFAAPNPATCKNDIDCVATPECGGDVCDYFSGMVCKPAGSRAKGTDGWCDITHGDDDCKCKAQGAKCMGVYCTFTKASDAPAGGGTGGSSGGSDGGSSDGGSGGSGGKSGTGGSGSGTDGGKSSGGGGGGGCSLAGGAPGVGGLLGSIGLLALAVRRRRR
jgi:MYXO-CTERM domain-containing protein